MRKTMLKAIASIGSGGISAILMAIIVAATHLNVASVAGGAVTTGVVSISTAFVAWAVAQSGPAVPPPSHT